MVIWDLWYIYFNQNLLYNGSGELVLNNSQRIYIHKTTVINREHSMHVYITHKLIYLYNNGVCLCAGVPEGAMQVYTIQCIYFITVYTLKNIV